MKKISTFQLLQETEKPEMNILTINSVDQT
jgi:hypothetical protein